MGVTPACKMQSSNDSSLTARRHAAAVEAAHIAAQAGLSALGPHIAHAHASARLPPGSQPWDETLASVDAYLRQLSPAINNALASQDASTITGVGACTALTAL